MNEPKKIYSLNLAAAVLCQTNLIPDVLEDTTTNSYYFVFPECAGVKLAVKEFKKSNPSYPIHDFLHSIKLLRETMAQKKASKE